MEKNQQDRNQEIFKQFEELSYREFKNYDPNDSFFQERKYSREDEITIGAHTFMMDTILNKYGVDYADIDLRKHIIDYHYNEKYVAKSIAEDDNGIDAYYVEYDEKDPDLLKEINFFAFKIRKNSNRSYTEKDILSTLQGVRTFLSGSKKRGDVHSQLQEIRDDLSNNYKTGEKVIINIYFCTNGLGDFVTKLDEHKIIKDFHREVNGSIIVEVNIKGFGAEKFIEQKILNETNSPSSYGVMHLLDTILAPREEDITSKAFIGKFSLSDVKNVFFKNKNEKEGLHNNLFADNVRYNLEVDTKVNSNIIKTLHSDPDAFFKYNNGLTIVCDNINLNYMKRGIEGSYDEHACWKCDYEGMKVVNGAQTLSALGEFIASFDPNLGYPNIYITVRFFTEKDEKTKNDITRYTNTQNIIKNEDLKSLDERHDRIAMELQKRGYYYLNKKMGRSQIKKIKNQYGEERIIEREVICQCFRSIIYGPCDTKNNKAKMWKDEEIFEKVMNRMDKDISEIIKVNKVYREVKKFLKLNKELKTFPDFWYLCLLYENQNSSLEKIHVNCMIRFKEFVANNQDINYPQRRYFQTEAEFESLRSFLLK